MKSRADIMLAFVEAIQALGGTVEPLLVHDDDVRVSVPKEHEEKANAIIDKFLLDLAKASPS